MPTSTFSAPLLICIAFLLLMSSRAPAGPRSPEELPAIPELPDPFLLADGSRVASPADWPKRRAELLELVLTYEYGHLPPASKDVKASPNPDYRPPEPSGSNASSRPTTDVPLPEGTREEKLTLTVDGKVSIPLIVTVPPGKGPFPVIVRGDLNWGRVKPSIAAEVAKRGYLLAQFDRTAIVPDKKGPREGAAYAVYPEQDYGALAAWAWGYHRTIDYLVTRPDVDAKKIAVTGHSRGGKTTLLAGATDERIALTNPNNSGCGGAGCYRFQAGKSEDLAAILKNFPYWFQADMGKFIGKIEHLPIDQHSVKALVAPRGLLQTEALGDIWANPEGSQHTHLAAREVYAFLGAPEKIALVYREGKHEHNLADWTVLMDYADKLFAGKTVDREFNDLHFKDSAAKFPWKAPGK